MDWKLITLSLISASGKFEGQWYSQKKGIPTGGSLCVELANITVFYLMNKNVYENTQLMKHVKKLRRYIDDGSGFFTGSNEQFKLWIGAVNSLLAKYELFIDEYEVKEIGVLIPFLDIQF